MIVYILQEMLEQLRKHSMWSDSFGDARIRTLKTEPKPELFMFGGCLFRTFSKFDHLTGYTIIQCHACTRGVRKSRVTRYRSMAYLTGYCLLYNSDSAETSACSTRVKYSVNSVKHTQKKRFITEL